MIRLNNVSKHYGAKKVIQHLSLELNENIINVVLGPSGSGKTTFLEMLANPARLSEGSIEISDNISYIFQEPRLLPNKTVQGNLEFVLKQVIQSASERLRIINQSLELVDLVGTNKLYPRELSGGMAQRLAIARAFCFPSSILLMDEAFKSLDIKLKMNILHGFLRLWQKDRRTVVCVTHDIDEALLIADEILVFSKSFSLIKRLEISQNKDEDKLSRNILSEDYLMLKTKIYNYMEN